ncbi:MAG: indole-3-glycerol phosphate synthase TrpC [Oligoflexales bacterium]|nr:indole-3-glycerol phosphate synthase TrpC [Oligoflexales bacterium]
MSEILSKIIEHKKLELEETKSQKPLEMVKALVNELGKPKDFLSSLKNLGKQTKVIAECKRKSPSKGILCDPYHPVVLSGAYERGGAAAISCLTDQEFFGGSLDDLRKVSNAVDIPVMRKDFIIDEYQIWETRLHGGDSFLLLSGVIDYAELQYFCEIGRELGMEPLVESHSEEELQEVFKTDAQVIGVNCRNLNSFEVSLDKAKDMIPLLREQAGERIFVSESGISSKKDLDELRAVGYEHFLIGEYLVKSQDHEECLRNLLSEQA